MEEKKKFGFDISSFTLHVLAMFFMLLDHMWATITPGRDWMTFLGRIAFPIFAFMVAEGYRRTKDFKKYALRMLIFALISEVPFDLMYNGTVIYPFHQNVMWTFLIALIAMRLMDKVKGESADNEKPESSKGKPVIKVLGCVGITVLSVALGFATFVDYYGTGVFTVLVFYFFSGRKWWDYIGQFLCIFYINYELLAGRTYFINIFGNEVEVIQQAFAILSLIFIWLYKGRQGYHSKWFQYFCYAFYPGHIVVLLLLSLI